MPAALQITRKDGFEWSCTIFARILNKTQLTSMFERINLRKRSVLIVSYELSFGRRTLRKLNCRTKWTSDYWYCGRPQRFRADGGKFVWS
ncbi:MAG: hypothetical protein ACTS47_00570 [Candidatus Hodgkinia cicadicola]